ncbi:MAG: hypothetical protein MHM6MM_002128 [Cercozoa sp. M6MM]
MPAWAALRAQEARIRARAYRRHVQEQRDFKHSLAHAVRSSVRLVLCLDEITLWLALAGWLELTQPHRFPTRKY